MAGLQYNDIVTAQQGQTRDQLAATAQAATIQPGQSTAPTLANGQQAGGLQMPNTTTVATAAPATPTVPTTPGAQALGAAQASGAPPQDAGAASAAVSQFLPTTTPTFYKPTTPVAGYDPQTVFDAQGKPLSYEAYIKAGGAADFSNVKAGSPPPASPTTSGANDTGSLLKSANVDAQLAEDKGYQQLLADRAEYSSVANQTKSLSDTYTELTQQMGIPGMNTELLNWKNIIDGTEDDLRKEIQASGGFATNSQVLALSNARNKGLIKNYNALLDAKNAAMETVNNMVGLASQDRQFALQSITEKMNLDQQINDYRDKFVNNAKEGYNQVINAVGYAGLYNMLQADPSSIPLVEKTLGLTPGGLTNLVATEKAKALLAQQNAIALKSTALPSSAQEYEYAKANGYKGTYEQYQNEDANRKAKAGGAGLLGGLTAAQINATVNQIAGSFDNEAVVKNFNVLNEANQFVKSLSDSTTNPVDDQGLIYALAKSLDPSSAVREGEYATAQKYAQSLIQSYGKSVTQALNGTGFLSDDARANIKKTIESKYQASLQNYNNVYNQYQQRIQVAKGGQGNTITDYSQAYQGNNVGGVDLSGLDFGF